MWVYIKAMRERLLWIGLLFFLGLVVIRLLEFGGVLNGP